MDFDDYPDGNERLRTGIKKLYKDGKGLSSSRLIELAEDHFDRLVAERKVEVRPHLPDQSSITKYRTGVHRHLRTEYARAIWDYIRSNFPDVLGLERSTDASFINGLFWYYGVDWRKHETLTAQIRESTFLVYHFTEMLADRMPDAVVVGEITLGKPDDRLMGVTERQEYDGRLGRGVSRETNQGYCFPKFESVCMLLKGAHRNAPKLYVFHKCGFGDDNKVSWMKGRLARISEGAPLFTSNVYAERVLPDHGTPLNILPRAVMPAAIMMELDGD